MKKLTIDGNLVAQDSDESISLLEIAAQLDIEIPSLCQSPLKSLTPIGEKRNCDLCQVEVQLNTSQGDNSPLLVKACQTSIAKLKALASESSAAIDNIAITTQSSQLTELRQAALTDILSDHYADCEPPCQQACPAGVDIQSYLQHIAKGDHREATKVVKQSLPLPLSIGRVCPAFCETECRRSHIDDPVAIRLLKRHAADLDINDANTYIPPRAPNTGKKVAIIGSGPAGITTGYYLSNSGHEVTIFESMPKAGGWLRYGIPEYRLPKAILDKEIEHLCLNGLTIKTDTKLGQDIHLDQLVEGYDAVCLAVGAQKAVPMNYPGSDLDGCYLGVDYLKDLMIDRVYKTGKKVAVIGGGNTAMDCARSALREGADVTLIYRRTRDEMPAEEFEIEEAEHEGVKFHFLTNPLENHSDDAGRVSSITFEKMALGEPDASGRRKPVATGETFTEEFDTVIPAVSQSPDLDFLDAPNNQLVSGKLALTRWNTFEGCEHTMSAGVDKLFVMGDVRTGPATAIAAVADGKKAAVAIEVLLTTGINCEIPTTEFNASKQSQTKAKISLRHYPQMQKKAQAPVKSSELDIAKRLTSYDEVEIGIDAADVIEEAKRCLECGCQANTDCKLRDYATEYKVLNSSLSREQLPRQFSVDTSTPFITFDANRCISCGACVETCHDQSGHNVISFQEDHYSALPIEAGKPNRATAPRVGFSASMSDSQCVQCGNCVQVCPTGALVDARDKSQGRPKVPESETKTVESTICTYCGVGCRIDMHIDPDSGKLTHITGNEDSPVNEGMLCVKGRYGFDFIQSPERLTHPLIRKEGELVKASWDEALSLISDKFSSVIKTDGGDALGGLASAKTTNEDNYLFQKLFRSIIGTNNVDHCARLCHASTVSGLYNSLGSGAMTNNIDSIKSSDLIFIIGSDTSSAHPIIASHIKRAIAENGARLVVADPKRIEMADHAQLYVCQKPGTDVMLINGIMQHIIANNWQDSDYIDARVEDFELVKEEVMQSQYSLENTAKVTGIPADDIKQLAELIGTAEKTAIYYAMGITQHTSGHDNVTAISNLQLLCGNIGMEGAGINPLRGQSNVQGCCDMGALPSYFPGYQQVTNSDAQQRFMKHWGNKTLPSSVGLAATQMTHAMTDGKLKALYVMGENPVLSDPNQAHIVEALKSLELLVVQDIFLTETAQLADVVLPAYSFAEKEGHFTNTERRVQQLQVVLPAPGEARKDWQVIQEIAQRLGADWHYQDERAIWHEVTEVTPQYHGITWDSIDPSLSDSLPGIQWPCPEEGHPGTPVLHKEKFTRGKGKMAAVSYRLPAELPCDEYPLTLSTGRLLEQFHTGTLTRKTSGLDELASPEVMVSAFDADHYNISNGQMLRLSTRRGSIDIRAFVTKRAQAGVLFLPFHFAEAAANKLTIDALDPVALIPEFKCCAVKLETLPQESTPQKSTAKDERVVELA